MKKIKLTKLVTYALVGTLALAINSMGVSAEWKQDNNGWWNTEGSSYSVGWKQIDGKWYYFWGNGYMAHDTTVDGYILGTDGAWIKANSSTSENNNNNFTIDQFINSMKEKGVNIKVEDVEQDFLPATRKFITVNNDEHITVYIYNSNEEMEKDSLNIKSNGNSYSNGNVELFVDWIYRPYFYKKGNLIVQYVGENQKIISMLKGILGEQFLGAK